MGFVPKEEYYPSGDMKLTVLYCTGAKKGRALWAKCIHTGNPMIWEGYNKDELNQCV